MSTQRIYAIFLRQWYLSKHSVGRLFGLFYWSTLELFLWGYMTVYLEQAGGPRLSFITFLFGAIIFLNFLTRVQHGITISFLEDVWTRNFINFFSSPLTVNEYVLGLILTSIATTLISIVSMIVLAWLLFVYNIFQFGFIMVPFIAILFLFGWAVGIFATAIILRLGPSAEVMAWSIPALITPFSGVFYPISALPVILQFVARIIPSTYVFEGMRNIVLTGVFNMSQLFLALALSILFFLAAYIFLLRSYKLVLRKGLFTRFMTG